MQYNILKEYSKISHVSYAKCEGDRHFDFDFVGYGHAIKD